jgi:hypothetical protein
MADSRTPSTSSAKPKARKSPRKAAVEPIASPVVAAPLKPIVGKPAVEMSPIDRDQMIATAAYLRAVNRHFQPGHELEDWLSAEREIDALLTQSVQTPQ